MMRTTELRSLWSACLLMCLAGCARPVPATPIDEQTQPPVAAPQKSPKEPVVADSTLPSAEDLTVDKPVGHQQPLAAGAILIPATLTAPGTTTLLIRVRTAPGWHIYAVDRPAGTARPTRLELQLPDGVEPEGDWELPEPKIGEVGSSGQLVYEGDFRFTRRLKVVETASAGQLRVGCEIHYQACDPFSCRLPESLKVEASADVVQNP
jgi:DsbC/DsbD-like thiol-disulfide interchange protein